MTHPLLPMRIGHGFDLHRLEPGYRLVLGGQAIEHELGCAAHSDGDVVYHAVTDAILGALGQDDIGQAFPDHDPQWESADSSLFVRYAAKKMRTAGYTLGNLDATVILQRPKLSPHKRAIRKHLSGLLGCGLNQVNVKGKTHERVDALGQGVAVACDAVVLLLANRSRRASTA